MSVIKIFVFLELGKNEYFSKVSARRTALGGS
jgi:hypothetical protein